MIIWNGKEWVRFGGPVQTPDQSGFLKIDEWKRLRQEWLDFSVPSIEQVPDYSDRLVSIIEEARLKRVETDFFVKHVNKLLPPWK